MHLLTDSYFMTTKNRKHWPFDAVNVSTIRCLEYLNLQQTSNIWGGGGGGIL